jgi:hypothetical protein
MKASTQRRIWRWIHIILSMPIVGYIYGPVSGIPRAAFAVKWIFFPVVVLSGFWMWKGQWFKKMFLKKQKAVFSEKNHPIITKYWLWF